MSNHVHVFAVPENETSLARGIGGQIYFILNT